MVFRTLVLAVAVFVLFVGGGFAAMQVADDSRQDAARQNTTVDNETIVVEYDAYQQVDKAQSKYTLRFHNDSVSVYNNSSAELVRGTDYEWNNTDGTIIFNDTPNTSEGENATITYNVTENTEGVQDVGGPITTVVETLGKNGIYVAGFAFVIFLLALAGILGKFFWSGAEYGGGR